MKTLHSFLDDFRWLARDLASRPTCITELIPNRDLHTKGTCNVAGVVIGGFHFVLLPDGSEVPLLWRAPFPQWVQDWLVSFDNPGGDINNSDLELAGSIAHNDILAQAANVTKKNYSQLLRQHCRHILTAQRGCYYFGSHCIPSPSPGVTQEFLLLCFALQLCSRAPK